LGIFYLSPENLRVYIKRILSRKRFKEGQHCILDQERVYFGQQNFEEDLMAQSLLTITWNLECRQELLELTV